MRLYFLRHGHAEIGNNINDHDRALTDEGKKRMLKSAEVMRRMGVKPSHIFSSPRIRALQTAEIVSDALNCPVKVSEQVNFGFDIAALQSLVAELEDSAHVMLVGHEPTFSMTIHELTGADIEMKKGGLVRVDLIDRQEPSGVLVWLIAPKVFNALAEDKA